MPEVIDRPVFTDRSEFRRDARMIQQFIRKGWNIPDGAIKRGGEMAIAIVDDPKSNNSLVLTAAEFIQFLGSV